MNIFRRQNIWDVHAPAGVKSLGHSHDVMMSKLITDILQIT